MSNTLPIPLTILSGFLGAGKTTLLNNLLRSDHGLRIAVLVNDFGAVNIDAQLVVGIEDENTINLANGCICCSIRGDLLREAQKLVRRAEPPEYIIVETSGVSDPVSVAQTFLLPSLQKYIRLDSILTVVDAEQIGMLQGANAYLAFEQLAMANIIVINKTDLVSENDLQHLRRTWLYPNARIIETTFGRISPELILGVGRFDPFRIAERDAFDVEVHAADSSTIATGTDRPVDHALTYRSWSWASDQPLSLKALRKATQSLPAGIFRMKGVVQLSDEPERRHVLNVAGSRASLMPGEVWGESRPRTQLVAIGAPHSITQAEFEARFEKCLESRQPIRIAERILSGAISWIRR